MTNDNSAVKTIIGIAIIVVIGLVGLWFLKTILGFVWEYFWYFVALIVGVSGLLIWLGATKKQ